VVAVIDELGVEAFAEKPAALVDRERTDLALGELREVLLLQRLRAGAVDDVDEVVVEHERHPGGAARGGEDLHCHRGGQRTAAEPAVLLGDVDAHEAGLPQRPHAVPDIGPVAVVGVRSGGNLLAGHLTREVPDLALVVGQVVPLEHLVEHLAASVRLAIRQL
jgi:hypothetical protein